MFLPSGHTTSNLRLRTMFYIFDWASVPVGKITLEERSLERCSNVVLLTLPTGSVPALLSLHVQKSFKFIFDFLLLVVAYVVKL